MTTTETAEARVLPREDWQWLADQLRAWPEKRIHPERTMCEAVLRPMAADVIEAALAALTPPAQGGEWRWVPVEPTEAMCEAGYDATRLTDGTPQFADAGFCLGHAGDIYRAMLSAIPDASPGSVSAPTVEKLRSALSDDHKAHARLSAKYLNLQDALVPFLEWEPYGLSGPAQLQASDNVPLPEGPLTFGDLRRLHAAMLSATPSAPTVEKLRSALKPSEAMINAAARQLYKDYEATTDEHVEQVFNYLSEPNDEARFVWAETVAEMREWAGNALRAALSDVGEGSDV